MLPVNSPSTDQFSSAQVLETLCRHRDCVVAALLAALTVGATGAFLWPDTYVSSALLRVLPPAATDRLIQPISPVALAERITAIQQSILSRNTLAGMIAAYDLYPGERARMPLEDVIERMRRDIVVSSPFNAGRPDRHPVFRISFAYSDRFAAHRVAQNLTTRFMDENRRGGSDLNHSVTQFLGDEFEKAAGELRAVEDRLAASRQARGGSGALGSPGLEMHRLTLVETRAAAAQAGLGRAHQELALAESELNMARERVRRAGLPTPAAPPAQSPASPQRQALELELERLLARYKATHPDVERVRSQLQAIELRVAAPLPASPVSPAIARPTALPDADASERLMRAEGQVRAKSMEIARLENEAAQTTTAINALSQALAKAPDRSVEIEQLTREHELALQRHREARAKMLEGEAAAKMNTWQLGETLEVVDQPALPETPVAPNRAVIVAASAVLGLLLGAVIAAWHDWSNDAIVTIRQLRTLAPASILGGIPLLEDELTVRRRRRAAALSWASASLFSLVSIAGAVIYHQYRQR